jgi:prolyl oligopeptidase
MQRYIVASLLLITFYSPVPLMSQTSNQRTSAKTSDTKTPPLAYPVARRGDTVDDYSGTKVADPYRWLEDPDSPETRAWIEAENKITFGYLNDIPQRTAIKNRLTKLWNFERYTPPSKEANRYFYFKNDGLQNQSVLYTVERLDATPRVLLDPNKLSADGTVALSGITVTDDGKLLAYGLSSSGSDWQQWKVRDVATGNDLPDTVDYVKFSGASWTKDGKGFFYSRYDTPNENTKLEDANYFQKLYFHKLGTPQSEGRARV